ncbi:hypothetical protein CR513_12252, partial [Mucuna pruriens]
MAQPLQPSVITTLLLSLQTFRKVEINVPLLEAIMQIPKYTKFLKELCIHKRKKLKGDVEMGRNVFALIKSEQVSTLIQSAMPKKCRDPGTFTVPCTIDSCTFADAMLDLGISTNVMPSSVYKSLSFGDLEPTSVIIQQANRSIAHPLDIEDEPSSRGSTLILGKPFLMTTRTKIDVHAGTLCMEFGDNIVQFNIFEAMKHPIENHSIFGIDVIDVLVHDYMQLHIGLSEFANFVDVADVSEFSDFVDMANVSNFSDSIDVVDVLDFSDSVDVVDVSNFVDFSNMGDVSNFADLADFECMCDRGKECSTCAESHVIIDEGPEMAKVGEMTKVTTSKPPSPPSPTVELKPLLEHLKYAYLEDDQKLPIIIANNL